MIADTGTILSGERRALRAIAMVSGVSIHTASIFAPSRFAIATIFAR